MRMREDFTNEHMAWCNGGRRRVYAVEDQHRYCVRIKNGYKMCTQRLGRPTLKMRSAFGTGWSAKLTRDLFMSEHLSEPFIEKRLYQLSYVMLIE